LWNLVLLCEHHHQLVHEGVLVLEPLGDQRFSIALSDGTALPAAPALLDRPAPLDEGVHHDLDPAALAAGEGGGPLHLHYAVSVLARERDRVRAQRSPDVPAGASGPQRPR
jgi:hypothetical protein